MQQTIFLNLLCVCLLIAPLAKAQVAVAPVIGDNMVLQRDAPVPIWGTAAPHEKVTLEFQSVEFQAQRLHVTADDQGHWQTSLGKLAASSVPASMTIRGRANTLVFKNILVGEVWLVSGQSNMEFPMVGFPTLGVHLPEPIQQRLQSDLHQADCGKVRLFRIVLNGSQPIGHTDGWQTCDPVSAAPFSAVGFYFARELSERLGVPIGVMEAAVGGTRIEPWTPSDLQGVSGKDPVNTGTLFSKLVKPLAPYALRGVLWYQGESNLLAPGADMYAQKMRNLIDGWRLAWNRSDLPFEYALLAPMRYTMLKMPDLHLTEQSLPEFWQQQLNALSIPHTSIISTVDLVDMAKPQPGQDSLPYIMNLIHPGDKWDVAHRFALVALVNQYGFSKLVCSGPAVQRIERLSTGLQVDFSNADLGLVSKDGQPLTGFEVAGPDMVFYPASASLNGHSVIVASSKVKDPEAIRFGWAESAQPNLFNHDGLPAMVFQRMLAPADH